MRRFAAFVALAFLGVSGARAHPLSPALLELEELGESGHFAVRWRTPRASDALTVTLPATCAEVGPVRRDFTAGVFVQASEMQCGATGLEGATLAVAGLGASGADALVRIDFVDGHTVRALLRPDAPSLRVPARESVVGVFVSHVRMGAGHLLGGLDHLLFLTGLVALLGGGRRLLVAVTAFTAGHSVTLALAALGLVRAPAVFVEVAIAVTLVWLAALLTRRAECTDDRAGVARRPFALPFAFGLLHGLGFASALGELGIPAREIPLALGGFNVGIELGQLAWVAALLLLATILRRLVDASSARVIRWAAFAPAYAIGSLGIYWCLDRVAGAF
jgi:hypothetical protein